MNRIPHPITLAQEYLSTAGLHVAPYWDEPLSKAQREALQVAETSIREAELATEARIGPYPSDPMRFPSAFFWWLAFMLLPAAVLVAPIFLIGPHGLVIVLAIAAGLGTYPAIAFVKMRWDETLQERWYREQQRQFEQLWSAVLEAADAATYPAS
ncbi:hypothetical protein N8I71_17805 [Roseibacterium sp. SDUM158016]|uniref:hypothetical protein n=1 Tax=Roseicyclus sediminis TaxID=2980997 RepID=UPI0021D349E1|nr:hypothetical protein [Roseibacterium sp. SDUM158016]MCU4654698.1 hypothetical protein [Roseibacterium sp. SDUM158016]